MCNISSPCRSLHRSFHVWLAVWLLIDRLSRASIASDLHFGWPTEISFFNGRIVELGVAACPHPSTRGPVVRPCPCRGRGEEAALVPTTPVSPSHIANGLPCYMAVDAVRRPWLGCCWHLV